MPPRQARGHTRSLTGARRAHAARRASGIREEGDGENHQESMMGGGAGGNVRGTPPTVFGGAKFIQEVFTLIEQVVRNTVQAMQVLTRATDTRVTTTMKAFLQLRPPTFKGEPNPLMLQRDALQWWKTMEESVAKKWEPFKKDFLDQCFIDTTNEALRMEFINLVQGKKEKAKQFIRGLKPSIRNKIAGNLIKVYSTMVSAAAAIEETLNETGRLQIQNLNARELATSLRGIFLRS
ncbi:hypothetical protein Acr_11g0016870 [Actinidia rufa]|uniref:Retrotransposon gag domain-containing protein n=1 Tax=Actinidia rufa TaxID=165716 RepID=A0A7J0FFB5_9ERIC|nr:hypothetical protein Acr_11g0016870 [Actinidia rufa]